MRLRVSGLDYGWMVNVTCPASDGHQAVGVDVNVDKVAVLAAGSSPIAEPGPSDPLARASQEERVRAATQVRETCAAIEVTFVGAGTRARSSGEPDLLFVERICR